MVVDKSGDKVPDDFYFSRNLLYFRKNFYINKILCSHSFYLIYFESESFIMI